MDRPELRRLWSLLPPKLDLKKFMKVTLDEGKPTCTQYVLRGVIVYYGRHYWAYFYSQKFDRWYQFNDEALSEVGNFAAVIEKAVLSRCIPRTVFYERQDIIVDFLTEGGLQHSKEQDLIYFSDSKMQKNHFWMNGPRPARGGNDNRGGGGRGAGGGLAAAWDGIANVGGFSGRHAGGGAGGNNRRGDQDKYDRQDDCTTF